MYYSGDYVVTMRENKMRKELQKCMAREHERELKGLKELLAKSALKPSSTKTKQLLKDTAEAHDALRANILAKRLI